MGQPYWENIGTIKALICGFELCSSLSVNLSKSRILSFNVDSEFLNAASDYLACDVSPFPFQFLGIKIGCNPRRKSSWSLFISKLRNHLSSWKGKHLSLGGKVTLLNSVLNSIPLFTFSFYKLPKKVIQEIIKIQRKFLWNSQENLRRINWVAWSSICMSKVGGGLGVKNCDMFNMTLMNKWGWKILVEEDALWHKVLSFKYGDHENLLSFRNSKSSTWWSDLRILLSNWLADNNWFNHSLSCKVGNGLDIDF